MEREFLVRGGNVVTLVVKEILLDRLYVSCARGPDMTVRGRNDPVAKGAILVSDRSRGDGERALFTAFDGGLYDAARAVGAHVGDALAAEEDPPPERLYAIGRIRRHLDGKARALAEFAARLFEALRWARGRIVARADLESVARLLRGVSAAPFSRHLLPNAADDVEAGTDDRLSAAGRSLQIAFARRSLESPFTAISRLAKTAETPDADARARLLASVTRGRGMLFDANGPLDRGFRHERIVPVAARKLSRVAGMLAAPGPFDAAGAYEHFEVALAVL